MNVLARTNRNCYLCLQQKRKSPPFFLDAMYHLLRHHETVSDLGVVCFKDILVQESTRSYLAI